MRNRRLLLELGFLLLLVEHHDFNFILHLRMLLIDIDVLRYDVLDAITQVAAYCIIRNWLSSLKLCSILIEGKNSFRHWGNIEWSDLDLNILNLSYYGLIFTAFNTLQRPYNTQHVILFLVLFNRMICGVVVLLIAEQNVIKQRTLRRKETNCNL